MTRGRQHFFRWAPALASYTPRACLPKSRRARKYFATVASAYAGACRRFNAARNYHRTGGDLSLMPRRSISRAGFGQEPRQISFAFTAHTRRDTASRAGKSRGVKEIIYSCFRLNYYIHWP